MSRTVEPRPGYQALEVYRREAPPVEINLADNTNLFGSAPSALASLGQWAVRSPASYPTLTTQELRESLARWLGVTADAVLPGCGSNDLLDSTMRALGVPGSALAHVSPTFVMGAHFAASNSLVPIPVATRPDGQPDVEALLATGAPIIYLATPNNPSGQAASADAVRTLMDRAPGIVMLDEAYTEYTGGSWAQEAARRDNVVVTRTFSKAWGLAGLRIGYAVASPGLIYEIEKARGPYKVSAVAELAATAALDHDGAWLEDLVATTRRVREGVRQRLLALRFDVAPTDTNFLSIPLRDPKAAVELMAGRGIGVRPFVDAPVVGSLIRVSIGPEPMMERFLEAVREVKA
ncbi:MAG: aminotransferase class I/II-fold pyridoxal phosphate-dependent enzyme [Gemmatimonadales bacterium]|nr:aminotransferase class I/II-fold pyridoxal phosphate-dependent enzyme [Gemmatimonadales bacterium]